METNHEIFITRCKFGEERVISVQDIVKSISYPAGAEGTINTHGWCKDIFALLAIYPGWTQEQRAFYLENLAEQIIDALTYTDMNYIDDLHVTTGYGNDERHYTPQEFIASKAVVMEALGLQEKVEHIIEEVAIY